MQNVLFDFTLDACLICELLLIFCDNVPIDISVFLGGIRFEIKSKGDVLRHWYDVLKSPNKEHEQWHALSADVLDPQSK